jgi:hypothetical protein
MNRDGILYVSFQKTDEAVFEEAQKKIDNDKCQKLVTLFNSEFLKQRNNPNQRPRQVELHLSPKYSDTNVECLKSKMGSDYRVIKDKKSIIGTRNLIFEEIWW